MESDLILPGAAGLIGVDVMLPPVEQPDLVPDTVVLPMLHADQSRAYWRSTETLRLAIRCGRRWGKTTFDQVLGADEAVRGGAVGWFAPEYKLLGEAYTELKQSLAPIVTAASHNDVIRCRSGGRIDFWSLDNENAGRSRKYSLVIIDEGAFGGDNLMDIWERSIEPTLLDYRGACVVTSNTNGNDPKNFLWQICNKPELGFSEFHAPTINNPLLPARRPDETDEQYRIARAAYFADLREKRHPLVYQQEYLAEFVDWSGVAFFSADKLLNDGKPVAMPSHCDYVFAVIDSATKTGKEHDGTAVVYFARSSVFGTPLTILDWDIVQIQGDLLITWLPTVFQNLEALSRQCGARNGSAGAFVEDKASGMILIQQATRQELPVTAIDSKLTSLGKDERAISVSGYVYQGLVKIAAPAFHKVSIYKETSRNHLMGQVTGFRIGTKGNADDDLLDDFCYGIALSLGNAEGF